LALAEEEVQTCDKNIDAKHYEGVCLTPIDVAGRAHFVDAADHSLDADYEDSARIVKAGAEDTEEVDGEIFGGADFSLLDSSTFNGTNELFSAYERKPLYSGITFESVFLNVKFFTKNKYVTMLLVSTTQPFVDSSIAKSGSCALSAEEKTMDRYVDADILSDMTFQRGDYLFCVKDDASSECKATDYKWFNLDTNQLVDERPSKPRVNQWFVFDEPSCSVENGRKNFSFSGVRVMANLTKKFKLYSDFSHGHDSAQWPDAVGPFGSGDPSTDEFAKPFPLYYHQPEGGDLEEGTGLKVTLDFNVENSLFLEGMDESGYDSASLFDVLKIVDIPTNIGFHKKGQEKEEGYNPAEMYGLSVTPSVEVSGGRNPPSDD
jgi:hypothetical protein